MSQQVEPEEMLKRVFRVAEILASSESAYQIMKDRKTTSKALLGKCGKSVTEKHEFEKL